MFQQILVAAIVIAAAAFSVWKLLPARRRLRMLLVVDGWAAGHPRMAGWRERSLKPRIARAGGPGCDGCGVNHAPRPR